jgi:hypothetical protein
MRFSAPVLSRPIVWLVKRVWAWEELFTLKTNHHYRESRDKMSQLPKQTDYSQWVPKL